MEREWTPEERKAAFDAACARVKKFSREPRTKAMKCSDCGRDMPGLYSARTVRVWCQDCSMTGL